MDQPLLGRGKTSAVFQLLSFRIPLACAAQQAEHIFIAHSWQLHLEGGEAFTLEDVLPIVLLSEASHV